MSAAPFDPLAALRILTRNEVVFIVIGGMAGRVWGSPTVTNDLDICYERSSANRKKLAAALRGLNARLRDAPEGLPFVIDERTIGLGDAFTFETDAGNLDCMATPAGTTGYDDLARNASAIHLSDDLPIQFASIDDVLRMKRAAARPKDLIEVEILEAVKREGRP